MVRPTMRLEGVSLVSSTSHNFDGDARDDQNDDRFEQRGGANARRGKASKRRKGPKSSNAGLPGGIRQRKNKRWAW